MITRSDVAGIPVLHTPRPGPVRAGLVFRVGQADETLPQRGITHMVEHLALHRQGIGDTHHNGATADVLTHFLVRGSAAEVVAHLNSVCASLTELPLRRLETEKEILRTEAARRSGGPVQDMPLWRYGATGHGVTPYPEWGVDGLTGEQVQAWAARWFTRQNAVLWITAETLPEGLELKLPDGVRQPLPAVASALPVTPAYFAAGEGGVAVDAVVRRGSPAYLFRALLGRELFQALRQDGGYSYTAQAEYQVRDAEFVRIVGYADALPEKQDAVLGGFVDVLAKLRRGRIAQADLDSVRQQALNQLDEPHYEASMLPSRAADLLFGRTSKDAEQLRAEYAAVTVADLHAVAEQVAANALLLVPHGHSADWAGFTAAPVASAGRVLGTAFPRRDGVPNSVVLGEEGVSIVSATDQITVRWADCVAVAAYQDGGRHLIGWDAMTVRLEPTLFRIPAQVLAELDARIPASVLVRLPERPAGQIPRPRPVPEGGPEWAATTGLRRLPGVVMAISMTETNSGWGASALLLVFALLFGRAGFSSGAGTHGPAFAVLAVTAGAFGLMFGAGTAASRWRRWRRAREAG